MLGNFREEKMILHLIFSRLPNMEATRSLICKSFFFSEELKTSSFGNTNAGMELLSTNSALIFCRFILKLIQK